MFNTAIIKKGKSEKANKVKKVNPSLLDGIDEIMAEKKVKTTDSAAGKVPSAAKVPESKVPSTNKVKPEAIMEIDLMLSGAKKKPSIEVEGGDSYTKEKGYFKSEKYKNKIKARSEK